MGNYVKFTCLVRSSLTNLRCPGKSSGCGLGEVGQLIYSDPPLTYSPSISSRWILSIVATAGVGSFTTTAIIFALNLPRHYHGMLSRLVTMVSNHWYSGVWSVCPAMYSGSTAASWCYDAEVSHFIDFSEFFSDDAHNIIGCGKPIFRLFHSLLKSTGLFF